MLPRVSLAVVLVLLGAAGAPPAAVVADESPPKEKAYGDPRALAVSPRRAPTPALKYRFLPLEPRRTPGDAAPVYIRLASRATNEAKHELMQKTTEWADLPLDRLPLARVRAFLETWTQTLQQLDFGARRETCRWNYTLPEQREQALELLLPDAQDMRGWIRLLSLKARWEIAEGRREDAARTIETGIAASLHTSDGPFVINWLVGVAGCQVMLGCVEDWIGQPDAPNLYWTLTALPRPLDSGRRALENEEVLPEWLLPELLEVDRPHPGPEWTLLLARLHARMKATDDRIVGGDPATRPKVPDLATLKAEALGPARAYVKRRRGETEGLPDDQVVLLYLAGTYRELYDDTFKDAYLPFPQALAGMTATEKRHQELKGGPLGFFITLLPNVEGVRRAEARLERTVAALRVIEALRMHAAEKGRWPRSLDEVTIVPVPGDPLTGKPFEYRLEDKTAVLVGPETTARLVLTYKLTLRP